MRIPLIVSFIFHLAIIVIAWLGVPMLHREPPTEEQPIFVEMVDVAEIRNAPPPAPEKPQKEEAKKETPKKQEVKPEPPKPQPAPPPPPKPEAVAVPSKPEPEPAPKPEAKPAPEPEPKKDAKPEPKPEPAKPQLADVKVPKKPKKKKESFDTASVLKTLEKIKQQAPKEESKEKPKDKAKEKKTETVEDDTMARIRAALNKSPAIKYDPNKKVSQLEIDQWRAMIRKQVAQCWSPPFGAPGAEKLKPELRLTMNQDGTVNSVTVEDTARMFTDRYFQVAAEAARRAVLDPRCNRFDLPADKYPVWKDMKFVFDPSGML